MNKSTHIDFSEEYATENASKYISEPLDFNVSFIWGGGGEMLPDPPAWFCS